MKLKLPKLSAPNLSLPTSSKSKSKISSLLKGNKNVDTGGMLNNVKSKIPEPLNKFVPNINSTGKTPDITKIVEQSSFDVDGVLSKSMNMGDITKGFSSDLSFDIGSGSSYIPSEVLSQSIDLT